MPCMVSYPRRPQSGQIMCYLNRTYHVLTTRVSQGLVLPLSGGYNRRKSRPKLGEPMLQRLMNRWPFIAVLVFLATSRLSSGQPKAADLSGFWLRDDGGVIKISVNGANDKAVHFKVVPENRDVYGFEPGDVHFEGIAHGLTITGKVMGHL